MENFLKHLLDSVNEDEKLDLTKKEDEEEYHGKIDEVRENEAFLTRTQIFGYDLTDELDELDKFADNTFQKAEEKRKQEEKKIERPSTKLTTEQGLQIHKLVQEYVDTMVRPFNNGVLSNAQINDAYAGLYEFAAWILNKK
mgnify:FL=1